MPVKRPSRKSAPAHSLVRGSHSHNDWDDALEGDDDHDDSGMDMLSGGGSGGGGSEIREIEESLKRSMAVDTGLRKEQKQQRLEKEFESHVRQLEGQIDERLEEGREDVVRIQDAHLSRLLALSRRKAEVEAQIVEHTRELADAFLAVKEEFEAVLRGRSADVNEAIESLNRLEEAHEAASPK
ncbi:hypothetical protein LTR99_010226 [Exophiala xenobiotica]|uniref:Coiled-coil domain-containing protein 153 n=1 Tax=Vermiconidia calcicola TaxID=1690605 RepID=A0AAV9Q4P0_9PEZI|nr:hypothetical protein LTR92_007192 [Exophiala xenobiotica]KAK5533945.1 hypothetical protein LTR25_006925 [Vermiconidia calcicola]KAK5546496.1 hypothetical protein LTR23_003601 [Chaetothyriales sp. CCFEE 6169]KAK5272161.1 hypothetical protein LTR96_001791 [Exophiala xenobiotica]KAK5277635.1 hypothetical protein LTR40_010155 [Exophiala xenobiotica]